MTDGVGLSSSRDPAKQSNQTMYLQQPTFSRDHPYQQTSMSHQSNFSREIIEPELSAE